MRVFITGGAGYVGSAVTVRLSAAGHEVLGLVRTDERAERLRRLGAEPVLGDIRDPASFIRPAADCDAVVHLAQAQGADRAAVDAAAVEAFIEAGDGSSRLRAFVYTSVLFVLGDTGAGPAAEAHAATPPPFAAARAQIERRVLESDDGSLVRAVIRPGMVYGGGAGGSVSELFRGAVEEGAATYVGGGRNRWSLVHREDAAELFRLVVERRASGYFHAADGHPLAVREVAESASTAAGAGGRTKSWDLEEARSVLGAFADALCLDQVADASRARALGWAPARPSFDAAAAFAEWEREERADVQRFG
ncbi:MAG TPA: NAD-dependent epimerase/dehydratase family protein [Pyrinomonadaceae bacterium]|nr:NAD-dependent epimerase/dehydratase family protein [Pyrinomonadaceae bacterium]